MPAAIFISAIVLGLASSFHCVGMCGPLIMAVPFQQIAANKRILGMVVYHLGRIMIYALLGMLAAALGRQLHLFVWQQTFSVVLGVILLITVGIGGIVARLRWVQLYQQAIYRFISYAMQKKNFGGVWLLGMANGLLPCGMVYIAATGAMAADNVPAGALFMFLFGMGTLPLLFIFTWMGTRMQHSHRKIVRKATPFLILITGVLLILRGMNLDIPYLSPTLSTASTTPISCH